MGLETVAIAGAVGLGAYSAMTNVQAGREQAKSIEKQSAYNAQIFEQQGQMVLEQKRIRDQQYLRQRKRAQGAVIAGAAGKGFQFSGSPLAVMADVETQLGFDKSIEDYNSDVQRNLALSGADYSRGTGRQQSALARHSGYSGALKDILTTTFMVGAL